MKLGNSNDIDGYWQWSTALTERIPRLWLVKTGLIAAPTSDADKVDVLDAHARRLVAGHIWPEQPASHAAVDDDEVAALIHLAEQVAQSIQPVSPAPRFRAELRRALLSTHRQQIARRRLFAHPLFEQGVVDPTRLERLEINSPWFWQAAATVPVLLVVTALIWRYTHRVEEQAGEVVA